jgi:hypothetical protein
VYSPARSLDPMGEQAQHGPVACGQKSGVGDSLERGHAGSLIRLLQQPDAAKQVFIPRIGVEWIENACPVDRLKIGV